MIRKKVVPQADEPKLHRNWILDIETMKRERLKLPNEQAVYDVSGDGKTLLTFHVPSVIKRVEELSNCKTYLVPFDTLKPAIVPGLTIVPNRLSVDGKAILGTRIWQDKDGLRYTHLIYDVVTGNETKLREPDDLYSSTTMPVWTGIGRGAAFLWYERNKNTLRTRFNCCTTLASSPAGMSNRNASSKATVN